MYGRNKHVFTLLAPTILAALLAACSGQSSTDEGEGDETRGDETPPRAEEKTASVSSPVVAQCLSGTENLQTYTRKCTAAMANVAIPGFLCDDDGTLSGHTASTEPLRQGAPGAATCDAPNVLNGACDAGSKFHMLHRNVNNDGIYIAAHCRKIQHPAGEFGDIAMIAYNSKTGATCFFQALSSDAGVPNQTLLGDVKSPSLGTSLAGVSGAYPWRTPFDTAATKCISCHDNGPFIRSPYLAQLGDLWPASQAGHDPNYLPGTIDAELFWNSESMPYKFVGLDFQSWEAYSVKNDSNGSLPSTCTGCHRLGLSQKLNGGVPTRFPFSGTSRDFGLQATALQTDLVHYQHSKNPYSAASPIWMTPGNIDATPWTTPGTQGASLDPIDPAVNTTSAQNTAACAGQFVNSGSVVPTISSDCHIDRFARGDTCTGPTGGTINGGTHSDTTGFKSDLEIPLGCKDQPGCPVGFYYWTSLHGPFYQTSVASIPITSPNFLGSALRITVENGSWVIQEKLNATDIQQGGGASPGAPGGTYGGIGFSRIASIPAGSACGSGIVSNTVADPTGGTATTTTTLFSPASASLGILSGFIGNVSTTRTSFLRVMDIAAPSSTILTQSHTVAAPPAKLWFTAEEWNDSCSNWAPSAHYAAQNVFSNNDVQLVTAAVAPHVICYITGITGKWADSRPDGMGGMNQPYATISAAGGDLRLQVWPPAASDSNGVGAYASCLTID